MQTGLYIVATPIGNLADLTHRALEVLREAALVAAEDTRHSQRLLAHYDIRAPLVAYHDHAGARAQQRICEVLEEGGSVALISDAGTPLVSDPGYRLVRQAQDMGVPVIPVPGACAAVAALSAAGLATDHFRFEGFLPAKSVARQRRLAELAGIRDTQVFYEAPHRVAECLADMAAAFGGEREAALARELTKTFETIRRAPLAELAQWVAQDSNQQRGEIVLLVSGLERGAAELDDETERLLLRLAQEMPAKSAAAVVADLTGLRKKALYDFLVAQRDTD